MTPGAYVKLRVEQDYGKLLPTTSVAMQTLLKVVASRPDTTAFLG